EGAQLLAEGVDPQTIERAATSAGFPAPPLAMLDEVSLTLTQHIRSEAAKAAAAEGRELASTPGEEVIDSLVALGRKGRAAGAGLYDYPEGAPKVLWPELRQRWSKNTQIPLRDLQDRYLFRMALETATCFEEGVLTDAESANIGGIFGIGFPPHTGGPATFMTNYEGGLAGFVARANELADTYGERFRPSAWLTERAASGTLVDAPVSAA
ncbi:MAG: 3-hydroxyacyl-CoA dehydrogenase family protein, partial [Knoellia sp.]